MVQGFGSTIPAPKLLVSCAGHLMTQCSITSMTARVFPASCDLHKTERIVDEAREKAHTCPIFWFRGLPPSDWYPELPVADDPFVEDFGSLDIMGGHVFTDGSGSAETKTPSHPEGAHLRAMSSGQERGARADNETSRISACVYRNSDRLVMNRQVSESR